MLPDSYSYTRGETRKAVLGRMQKAMQDTIAELWPNRSPDTVAKTPQEALDSLCAEQERVLERLERAGVQGDLGPKMNEEKDPQEWLDAPGAPVAKLDNEKPKGETVSYDELIKSWQ